jgi:hypothetical protein
MGGRELFLAVNHQTFPSKVGNVRTEVGEKVCSRSLGIIRVFMGLVMGSRGRFEGSSRF